MFVGVNYPEFKIWLHFLNDELASGFDLDALRSSHPIEVCVSMHYYTYCFQLQLLIPKKIGTNKGALMYSENKNSSCSTYY